MSEYRKGRKEERKKEEEIFVNNKSGRNYPVF